MKNIYPISLLILVFSLLFGLLCYGEIRISLDPVVKNSAVFVVDDSFPGDSTVNDLKIVSAKYGGYPEADGLDWENLEYTEYPTCQVRPLVFSAMAINVGSAEQMGVFLEVNVSDDGDYNETIISDITSLLPGDSAVFYLDEFMPSDVSGTYEIQYIIHQDQEDQWPANNIASRIFKINEGYNEVYQGNSNWAGGFEFSRDNGEAQDSSLPLTGEDRKVGMGFYFTESAEVCCVGAAIMPGSTVSAAISFQILDDELYYLAETEYPSVVTEEGIYDPQNGQNFIWGAFNNPIPFLSGFNYVATVRNWSTEGDTLKVGINNFTAPDSSSFLIGNFDGKDCEQGCATDATYMIRLGLSNEFCATRVAEVPEQVTDFGCFPNPSKGLVTVHFSLLANSDIRLYLFDGLGRIVRSDRMGPTGVGQYTYSYNWSDLASGQYSLSLVAGGKSITQKLIIE